jgi:hypothetical protein
MHATPDFTRAVARQWRAYKRQHPGMAAFWHRLIETHGAPAVQAWQLGCRDAGFKSLSRADKLNVQHAYTPAIVAFMAFNPNTPFVL